MGAGSGVVQFDKKTSLFLAALLIGFILATALKIHGSSIGCWNLILSGRAPRDGVLLGTPKAVRLDEWSLMTPAIASQAHQRPSFPISNPSWGAGNAPLVMNLPVRHVSTLFRPQFWGFFVLALEYAFAFYWNLKTLLLVVGVFLLLMTVTNSAFWVSVFGTTWVYLSAFIQWWYSSPAMLAEMIGAFALIVVSVHALALSRSRAVIVTAALVLSVCSVNFVLFCYPPFQVPLAYLCLALLIGSLGPRLLEGGARHDLAFRVLAATSALVVIVLVLVFHLSDSRATMGVLRGTVYPGSRSSLGGELSAAQVFGGFYGIFMSERSFPTGWMNVCEGSGFILLFPIPLGCLVWRLLRRHRPTALEGSLAVYVVMIFVWVLFGWPEPLAFASAFSLAPGNRAILGLGIASIVWCCAFLSDKRRGEPDLTTTEIAVTTVLSAMALAIFSVHFNRESGGFAGAYRGPIVCILTTAACYFLASRKGMALAACVVIPSLVSHATVNPIAYGLGPITETKLFHEVSRIVDEDPQALWIVYGGRKLPDFVKATGARVLNGTQFVPPLQELHLLDPSPAAEQVYNRFARIRLDDRPDSGIEFVPASQDAYQIRISAANPRWRQLDVDYVLLSSDPLDERFLELATPLVSLPEDGFRIYRYRRPGGSVPDGL